MNTLFLLIILSCAGFVGFMLGKAYQMHQNDKENIERIEQSESTHLLNDK